MPEAASSKVLRKRASLSRSAASVCLRPVMSSSTEMAYSGRPAGSCSSAITTFTQTTLPSLRR
jgi:hypothetical protein